MNKQRDELIYFMRTENLCTWTINRERLICNISRMSEELGNRQVVILFWEV